MDFTITAEQKSMKKAVREFLKSECPSSFVLEMEEDEIGFTPEFWRKMGELGWMALVIPEEYDGVGGDLVDLVLMLEEMGRACAPGPFFSTIVLGGLSIMAYGTETQKREFLPKIAKGDMMLTLALAEPQMTRYDPFAISVGAAPRDNEYVINGTKLFVSDAHVADYIICAARTSGKTGDKDGITLFLTDAKSRGIQITPLKTIGGDKQFELIFEEAKSSKTSILDGLNEGGEHLQKILWNAAVCKCAEMVGGAEKVLKLAADHAKERKQFGKPIGSFQAVQHHCANMLIDIEGSRYITYKAAWMLSNTISCAKEVAAAKAWVSDAYRRVVGLGHQVQGGAGYIVEHDMPLFSRRAPIAGVAFGDANYYRGVVAQMLGL